jgi:hypothetical protein
VATAYLAVSNGSGGGRGRDISRITMADHRDRQAGKEASQASKGRCSIVWCWLTSGMMSLDVGLIWSYRLISGVD